MAGDSTPQILAAFGKPEAEVRIKFKDCTLLLDGYTLDR